MPSRETSPLQDATEELLALVLPVVLERMRNASRRLQECSERLMRDPERITRGGRSFAELEEVQEESERLGWVMGVLASAAGDDLLLARRETYGLALIVDLVGEVLAHGGRALEPLATELPDVAPHLDDGWRLPWGVGVLFRRAACSLPDSAPLRWRLERRDEMLAVLFPGADPDGLAPLLADLEALLPGTEALVEEGGFGMAFPDNWFAVPAGGGAS